MLAISRIQILLWVVIALVIGEIVFVLCRGPFSFSMISSSARESSNVISTSQNATPGPHKTSPDGWPDVTDKSTEYPFGPYDDGFAEEMQNYGLLHVIVAAGKN